MKSGSSARAVLIEYDLQSLNVRLERNSKSRWSSFQSLRFRYASSFSSASGMFARPYPMRTCLG